MKDVNERLFAEAVVLVTGAARGIGAAVAEAYLREGAHVVAWDKDWGKDRDRSSDEELNAADPSSLVCSTTDLNVTTGGSFTRVRVDVSDPEQVKTEMNRIAKKFGKIDILLNNAGFGIWKSPLDLSIEEWDSVLHTNLRGTFVCAREAARYMPQKSAIVNIASTRAFMSEPNSEAYAASKGGIVALTHALAASLGPQGIRVNAISPGWIETKDYEGLKQADHVQHPAGRVGKPSDIAQACFYLTDRRNDFVTGVNLTVDGGMTHKMIYVD